MDEIRLLPIWISVVLSHNVFIDVVEYRSGIRRYEESQHGCHSALDF